MIFQDNLTFSFRLMFLLFESIQKDFLLGYTFLEPERKYLTGLIQICLSLDGNPKARETILEKAYKGKQRKLYLFL